MTTRPLPTLRTSRPSTSGLHTVLVPLAAAACLCLLPGCGSEEGKVKAVTTQEVETGVAGIFKSATAETRQLALDVAEAIKQQDYVTAWEKVQVLGGQSDLTAEQRDFVTASTAALASEVHKAEAAGNEAAKQALEFHRANK